MVVYQPDPDTLLRIWIESERNTVLTADESSYLFPTKESEQISGRIITRNVRKAAQDAGLQVELYEDKHGNQKHEATPHTLMWALSLRAFSIASQMGG
jgi:site-specific recombinase XerD